MRVSCPSSYDPNTINNIHAGWNTIFHPLTVTVNGGTPPIRTNLYSILLQVGEAQQDSQSTLDGPSLSSVSVAEIYGWRMGFNKDWS